MLQRSDTLAYALHPIVGWVINKINQMHDPRNPTISCTAHTIGAYHMGLYVYPEAVHINVTSNLPVGATLRMIFRGIQMDPAVSHAALIQNQDDALLYLEFSVYQMHFRVYSGCSQALRVASYTRGAFMKSPLCRFAAFCLRHLVQLFSIAIGLPDPIIDATTVATLALVHHGAYLSTKRPHNIQQTVVYIQSLVSFIHQLRPNRVYTTTSGGQLIIDAPILRTESLKLDNPCVLHPLCHTRNLLDRALYFRLFQSWISTTHFMWLCCC